MMSQTSALRARVAGHGVGSSPIGCPPGDADRRAVSPETEGSMRSHWLRIAAACGAIALGLTACGSDATSGNSGGGTTISIWEGYTQTEAKAFAHLISVYNKAHPGQTVNSLFVNNDNSLQKVLTGERDVATVNGKVIGVPALVDNLAVVYNKTLFAQAGLKPPTQNWTWSQFVADAKRLTNPAKKQFGTAYVTPGTEDSV